MKILAPRKKKYFFALEENMSLYQRLVKLCAVSHAVIVKAEYARLAGRCVF